MGHEWISKFDIVRENYFGDIFTEFKKFKNFKIVSGFNYLISIIHLPTKKLKFEFKKKH